MAVETTGSLNQFQKISSSGALAPGKPYEETADQGARLSEAGLSPDESTEAVVVTLSSAALETSRPVREPVQTAEPTHSESLDAADDELKDSPTAQQPVQNESRQNITRAIDTYV